MGTRGSNTRHILVVHTQNSFRLLQKYQCWQMPVTSILPPPSHPPSPPLLVGGRGRSRLMLQGRFALATRGGDADSGEGMAKGDRERISWLCCKMLGSTSRNKDLTSTCRLCSKLSNEPVRTMPPSRTLDARALKPHKRASIRTCRALCIAW